MVSVNFLQRSFTLNRSKVARIQQLRDSRNLSQSNPSSRVVDALLPPPPSPDGLVGLEVAHHAVRLAEHAPHVRQLGRHLVHVILCRIRLWEKEDINGNARFGEHLM